MLRYHFTISHVPGKNLVMADTLSRAPESGDSVQDCLEQEVEAYVHATFSTTATERRMQEIRQHQEEDPDQATQSLLSDGTASQGFSNPIDMSHWS